MNKIKVKFPAEYLGSGTVGEIHYKFAYNLLKYSNVFDITYYDNKTDWPTLIINDKKVFLDYADWKKASPEYNKFDYYLKTQYTEEVQISDKILPWSQISFLDWDLFRSICKNTNYTCNTDLVLNNQKPYGNATERRLNVQTLLKNKYKNIDIKIYAQQEFFKKINNCLIYVHVPGYSNNMLDRAHVQMFALGVCIITTKIPNSLPNNKSIIPGVHYIQCRNDYSDLIEKIEWCRSNRNQCVEIGKAAQVLFNSTCSPLAISEHIKNNIV